MAKPTFATLGPEGSNHDLILQDYIDREKMPADRLLFEDFNNVLKACETGAANHVLICAVHNSCSKVVARAQYQLDMKITDVFVSESQLLAVLHRTANPRSLALHTATREYTNISSYENVIEVSSTVEAAEGLRAGKWDAALTAARFQSGELTKVLDIPPPRDAWLILGGKDKCPIWTL
ncbi:MAG: hypothetical protein AAFW66_15510 [Pseudomonadota bacterium]